MSDIKHSGASFYIKSTGNVPQSGWRTVFDVIRRMGQDAQLSVKDTIVFPDTDSLRYNEWDQILRGLSDEELETLASGEREEQIKIAEKYGIVDFHVFLDEVFDGDYQDCFLE